MLINTMRHKQQCVTTLNQVVVYACHFPFICQEKKIAHCQAKSRGFLTMRIPACFSESQLSCYFSQLCLDEIAETAFKHMTGASYRFSESDRKLSAKYHFRLSLLKRPSKCIPQQRNGSPLFSWLLLLISRKDYLNGVLGFSPPFTKQGP